MQNFWLAIFFFLLTCAPPSPLSYASAATLSRRHLYDYDSPLPPPLSPISPPFFPTYSASAPPPLPPSPPPPPPTFAVFPTFPANISALVLPRSSKPHHASPTLLLPAISAVLAVATVLGLALFLYGRHQGRNRHVKSSHCPSSSNTSRSSYDDEQSHITTNFNMAATTSPSEVFYLNTEESEHIRTGGTFFLKQDSPEIRPLPPLPTRSFHHNNYEAEVNEEDGEEDVFFSPMASLPGSETSSPSHSCSSSCSGWVSPARSFSMTMSPPNPRYSDATNLQSPSPERLRVRKHNGNGSASLRMFSFWDQNVGFGFPRISSASTSPDRGFIRTPLSSLYSSVSTSPDGLFRKFLDSSPPIWNDFSRNVKSVLLSHSASSRRDFVINIGESSSQQSKVATTVPALPPPTRPPPIVPPSQPFVVQNDVKKLSFSDQPPKQQHWDRLRSSSFKLDKEMVETLYIGNLSNPRDLPILNQESKVLDPRKAQNIATLLQLLNLTTKDVCQALLDGDCDALGAELLECLLRLAPSKEEERRLKSFSDDSVIIKLGPAERFLKELLHVPSVFKRVGALLFAANFNSEIKRLRKSFSVVQVACEELSNSRMFSILLDAVLKTGNKMNVRTNHCADDAHDFKLDTLLKLVDVKGLDGRSSLLHFVVQEMIKSEGSVRALEGISNLNSELSNVKKSADIEYGVLRSNVSKLCQGLKNIEELLLLSEESGSSGDQWLKFRERMARFLKAAAEEIVKIKIRESSTLSALEEVTEQFHGDSSKEGHTMRIFMIVRDFLSVLDNVCHEMGD
ncbi:PREDICTED: formin-like protein 9 [Camelina sativa]|uniref:Formin-like protein n=1 Tax=Camelina sativa TaxID=90675 RepID=A0ABM0UJZ9_CAMSA|nr:PREDICTED: formin-like protein 9 [Camelina sativa]